MNKVDKEYLKVLNKLREKSKKTDIKSDRTGVGTTSIFGPQIRFDFSEGFPILTTKKVYFHGIKVELLWFIGTHLKQDRYKDLGVTNIRYLLDNNVHIWDEWPFQDYLESNNLTEKFPKYTDEWKEEMKNFCNRIQEDDEFAKKWGTIGSGYGKQWIDWGGHKSTHVKQNSYGGSFGGTTMVEYGDVVETYTNGINQIDYVIDLLKNNPDSRRILVNAWNVEEIDEMSLPPCHYSYQFYTEEMSEKERIEYWCELNNKSLEWGKSLTHKKLDSLRCPKRKISILWNQRSADYFLGIPFNISSYSLLLAMIAQVVNMVPNEVVGNIGDCHLYSNHIEQADRQLSRKIEHKLPKLKLNTNVKDIYDFKLEDISFENEYESHKGIKAPIAV